MPSDDHKIVIRSDKTPVGEHARRFPTIDEMAIFIVGEQFESRDIVLHRRNNRLQRVADTHRSYDALQYPILSRHTGKHKYEKMFLSFFLETLTHPIFAMVPDWQSKDY
ncbi:hypothetical protein AVEN_40802-1 [Araneus ventricosus]|uniref:Uncharacterized protein n=1 Tax=Araneus ventricosus TaxID=182803 RepID=A0A4Y2CFV5_ARAVE|nr:hypothetical protein AVEN_40802-1 [Araneus ventricosus]